jgi:hypothetical protein
MKHISQRVIGPEGPLNSRPNTLRTSWPFASDEEEKAMTLARAIPDIYISLGNSIGFPE